MLPFSLNPIVLVVVVVVVIVSLRYVTFCWGLSETLLDRIGACRLGPALCLPVTVVDHYRFSFIYSLVVQLFAIHTLRRKLRKLEINFV
jgi:hypothetical protein